MAYSAAKGALGATAAGLAVASTVETLGTLTLNAFGFTAAGPAPASYAAAWMSSTAIANGGAVPAGSLYSVVQSTAMGDGTLLGAPGVLAVAAVAGAGAVVWKAWK